MERFDPEAPIAARCNKCGKLAYGPRKLIPEAMREHQESVCPAKTKQDEPTFFRLYYHDTPRKING